MGPFHGNNIILYCKNILVYISTNTIHRIHCSLSWQTSHISLLQCHHWLMCACYLNYNWQTLLAVQVSQRINNPVNQTYVGYKGTRKVGYGSINSRVDGESNCVGFVEIPNTFVKQDNLFFRREPSDSWQHYLIYTPSLTGHVNQSHPHNKPSVMIDAVKSVKCFCVEEKPASFHQHLIYCYSSAIIILSKPRTIT